MSERKRPGADAAPFADAPLADAPFANALARALPRLRRHAIALTGTVSFADDVVQECLERAWRGRGGLRDQDAVMPWLRRILHHAHSDALRERGRGTRQGPMLDITEMADELAAVTPADGLGASLDLVRAMDRLGPDHREILLLIALEGLSYQEAAATLDVPVGTVMSRLARARARLRELMDADAAPAPADPRAP